MAAHFENELEKTSMELKRTTMNGQGQNILMNDNTIAYVTNKNILKKYTDDNFHESCPQLNQYTTPDFSELDVRNEDAIFNDNIIKQGLDMVSGQSCFDTNVNVHIVDNDYSKYTPTWRGCNKNTGVNDAIVVAEMKNFEECKNKSIELNENNFGVQKNNTNTIDCYIGNTISENQNVKIIEDKRLLETTKEDGPIYSFNFAVNKLTIFKGDNISTSETFDNSIDNPIVSVKFNLENELVINFSNEASKIYTTIEDEDIIPFNKTNIAGNSIDIINDSNKIDIGTYLLSQDKRHFLTLIEKDDKIRLILGHFVISCSIDESKYYGDYNDNSIANYSLPVNFDNNLLNKVGYIDGNMNLRLYPESLLSYENSYWEKNNMGKQDVDDTIMNDSNKEECETKCNSEEDCKGFVLNKSEDTCWLKKQDNYTNSLFSKSENTSYIRKRGILNNSCKNEPIQADYLLMSSIPLSEQINSDTKCSIIDQEQINDLNTAYNTYKVFSSNKIDEIQNISIKNEETDTLNLNMANELSEKVNIYNNSSSKINNNNTMNAMMELSDIEKREKKLHLILWATLIISGVIIVLNIKK